MNDRLTEESKTWLKNQIRPYRKYVVILTVASVLTSFLSVAFAYLTRFLIYDGEDKRRLIVVAIVLVSIILARIAVRTVNSYLTEKYRTKMSVNLSNSAFAKTLCGKCEKISEYHSGELLNRITADSREIASDTLSIVPVTAGLITQFGACIVALLATDALFTLILLCGGGLIFALSAAFKSKLKYWQKSIMDADGKNKSFMQESIASAFTVKAYGLERETANKSGELLEDYSKKRVSRAKLSSVVNVLYSIVSNLGLVFAVVWCAFNVDNLNGGYGSILSVVLLMEQLQRPLTSFASIMPVIYARSASAERLYEIASLTEEQTATTDLKYDDVESIVFKNVDFSYGRDVVLKDFSVLLKKGEFTCLVGRSGAGKSTLFKLLLSFYEPSDGELYFKTVNGEKVNVTPSERSLFAFVPQGNFLFSGTIRENLEFFVKDKSRLSDEKIEESIKVACAEFVYELPDGLDTVLGERGGGLSEGQIQRLAVARAVLSENPILLLDEATSALDEKTEAAMVENLKRLDGRTCVMISHKPTTISLADRSISVG